MEQKVFEAKGLGPDGKDWLLLRSCPQALKTTFFFCIACEIAARSGLLRFRICKSA